MRSVLDAWQILEKKQRVEVFLLIFLMLFATLLEMMSVGIVSPFIGMYFSSDRSMDYPIVAKILNFLSLGDASSQELILGFCLALLFLFLFKAGFLLFLAWKQSKFVYGALKNISIRLFKGYLGLPYKEHMMRNSSSIIRNVINETDILTKTGFISVLNLVTELFVAVGIILTLIYLQPAAALLVTVIFLVGGSLYYLATRSKVLSWGLLRQGLEGQRIMHVQQSLGGIKDVIMHNVAGEFVNRYGKCTSEIARVGSRQNFVQQTPKVLIETLAVVSLILIVFLFFMLNKEEKVIVQVVGAYGVAAFRLMPSINRILGSLQGIKYSSPVISLIKNELDSLQEVKGEEEAEDLDFNDVVKVNDISFSYDPNEEPVLKDFNLEIKKGETIGIVGESGAGKSTLLDVLLGLLTPESGSVFIDEKVLESTKKAWQGQIGYIPQDIFLLDDTISNNITYGKSDSDISHPDLTEAIKGASLEKFIGSLPDGLETIVGERGARISGGQRQRIGIARALYKRPSVLVLDEATNALDLETEKNIMDSIYKLKGSMTIIIVAHRLNSLNRCDRVIKLSKSGVQEVVLDDTKY